MRVGKKPKLVEPKRTRSCVVRLEKVRAPPTKPLPLKKSNKNVGSTVKSNTHAKHIASPASSVISSQQDERKTKGPLKKRPIAQSPPYSLPMRQKQDTVSHILKNHPKLSSVSITSTTKMTEKPTEEDTATTVAAGRSRRSIKPNPKYASSDMVTPKMMKNAAHLTGGASNRKEVAAAAASRTSFDKKRAPSTSSSEDFYNKDSSDVDFTASEDEVQDDELSNYSDLEFDFPTPKTAKRMGNKISSMLNISEGVTTATTVVNASLMTKSPSTKLSKPAPFKATATTVSPAAAPITTITTKINLPTQINQLRKTISAANAKHLSAVNAKRLMGLSNSSGDNKNNIYSPLLSAGKYAEEEIVAKKRKLYEADNDSDSDNTTKRRKVYSTVSNAGNHKHDSSLTSNTVTLSPDSILMGKTVLIRKPQPKSLMSPPMTKTTVATTLNGNRIVHVNATKPEILHLEKPNTSLEKSPLLAPHKQTAGKMQPKALKTPAQKQMEQSSKFITKAAATKAAAKQRKSLSPACVPAQANTKVADKRIAKAMKAPKAAAASSMDTSSAAAADDFETMPTFTIVNINDIINKKGDVLISKSHDLSKSPTPTKDFNISNNSSISDVDNNDDDDDDGVEMMSNEIGKKAQRKKIPLQSLFAKKRMSNSVIASNKTKTTATTKKPAQTILNHTLSTKNSGRGGKARLSRLPNNNSTAGPIKKPAPRILNSMVGKKTQPIKPLIANLNDSADDDDNDDDGRYSKLQSNDSDIGNDSVDDDDVIDDDDDDFDDMDLDDDTYYNKRTFPLKTAKKKPQPQQKLGKGIKENKNNNTSSSSLATMRNSATSNNSTRKISPEKVVISRQGDKIIKKITCFENWYIINIPEDRPAEVVRNQLEMTLIKLANASKKVHLPSSNWSSKVTLYQLPPSTVAKLSKMNYTEYTGDLTEYQIPEEDRAKYQPSCVMFRRAVKDRTRTRLPYDRAIIFKNKTFFTNIDGKNAKLVGAPHKISTVAEVEILLQLMDELTLKSDFVEQSSTVH